MIDHDVTDWVDGCLRASGSTRTGDIAVHRERFWASVYTVPTDAGTAWLKTLPPAAAFEAGLYRLLVGAAPDRVLNPLGTEPRRGWLLLPEAGPPLGDVLRDGELAQAMAGALRAYAQLQQAFAPHVADALTAGVPDMRPQRLPARLAEALDAVAPFVAARGTDRQRAGYVAVRDLAPRYVDWCAELAASAVGPGIDHNDLHPGNVIGSAAHPMFWDWGDAAVAHPFASLLFALESMPGPSRAALRTAYLAEFGDPAQLAREADLAVRVGQVARALVWQRALSGAGLDHPHAAAPLEHLLRLLT